MNIDNITVNQFFAPVSVDLIDNVIARYEYDKNKIISVSDNLIRELSTVFHYFVNGNSGKDSIYRAISPEVLFKKEGAIQDLNDKYWDSILTLTDVRKLMPQKRREEWDEQIANHQTPEFNQENVRATVMSLLNSRADFIAEKVDGIFNNLSKVHVTNCPEGFYKRMIMGGVFSGSNSPDYKQKGYIDDLRDVIGRIMKRGEYDYGTTYNILAHAYNNSGKWISLDGNAIKIKAFKKGTVHLEIHPDIALELNIILSHLYPTAIPQKNRDRKEAIRNKDKKYELNLHTLPFNIIKALNSLSKPPLIQKESSKFREYRGWTNNENSLRISSSILSDADSKEIYKILEFLGGERKQINMAIWHEFDYDIEKVVQEIVLSGNLPDIKTFQYYPTPAPLAEFAVDWADIDDGHKCLEPSAGQGGIAKFLPIEQTTCVEISKLNTEILKNKGFDQVINDDFVQWASKTSERFDRIVMNPPFSDGRAELHTKMAFSLLNNNGVLVAILPGSFKNKQIIKGAKHEYSDSMKDLFAGTGVSVVVVRIEK